MHAQEAETPEPVTKKPATQKDSPRINFYMPFYTPDPMSFFMAEYENSLADAELVNFYLTALFNLNKIQQLYYENYDYEMARYAVSLGVLLPIWIDHLSFIMHATYRDESRSTGKNMGINYSGFFAGGGIRANFSILSLGFIGGAYGAKEVDIGYGAKVTTLDEPTIFKFTIPLMFNLSKQTIFIDKLIGNFSFDNYLGIDQLFSQIMFRALNIGAMKLGFNIYYKDQDYSVLARQQLIGASFTTKHLQFNGGYRFFTNYTGSITYADGPYGRMMVKIPFGKIVALGFSAAYGALDKKTYNGMSFGIGLSLFGNIWQTFVELGAETTVVEHIDYASLMDIF
jgi:hypothetical protein